MKTFKDYLWITLGVILVAAGIYFFKFPNNFSTGGVSGISVILSIFFKNISKGTFVLIINTVLLIAGLLILGRSFTIKTFYGSTLLSILLYLLEKIYPLNAPMTSQPFLELCFSVLLPAFGSAILFNHSASTGGTDITALILKKYTSLDIGRALFVTDFLITLCAALTFGIETGLFSMLGLLAKVLVVDQVIENFNLSKYFIIITSHEVEVNDYIKQNLHRGATRWDASGVFSGNHKAVVLTAVSRPEAMKLHKYVKEIDPQSFIVISNSSEIIGKGFRQSL